MKKLTIIFTILVSLFTINNCKKDDPTPTVVAKDLTCNVTSTNVTTNGGHDGTITVVVLTGNGDYIYSVNTTVTNTDGLFTNLTTGIYHIKVVDSENKTFTKDVTITEPPIVPVKPTVEISAATDITQTTVTLNGKVNPNGFTTTDLKFEYGTTTSYGTTIGLTNVSGNTSTTVTKSINVLASGTIYHYRLVATNSGGTSTSGDMSFTTLVTTPTNPTVNTLSATNIGISTVILNGNVTPNGGYVGGHDATNIHFEYGTTTSYGTSINAAPTTVSSTSSLTNVICSLTGLSPNTLYHYRLVANGGAMSSAYYGSDMTFTTLQMPLPTVNTLSATNIGGNSVTLNGNVNPNGYTTNSLYFEYGTTSSYGTIVTLTNVNGNTPTTVTSNITGLIVNTTYHYRLVAVNNGGTSYGNDMTFTTSYRVGDELFGGIIFYIYKSGDAGYVTGETHGLLVQKTDYNNGANYTWSEATSFNVLFNSKYWHCVSHSTALNTISEITELSKVNDIITNVNYVKLICTGSFYWVKINGTPLACGTWSQVLTFSNLNLDNTPNSDNKVRLVTTF